MTIQQTQWSPETCGCTIVYQWDDAVAPELRIHTLNRVVTKGAEHSGIIDLTLLSTLWDENRRKNLTFGLCKQEIADLLENNFQWAFTPGRVLEVTVVGKGNIPAAVKSRLQAACDLQFGPGKVVVL